MALLILFAALVSFAYSQGAGAEYWSAKFVQYTTATKAGANTGTILFNWPQKAFSISFDPAGTWSETYIYNTSRGYPDVLDGSLSTRSSVGSTCSPSCSISLDSHAMPPLAQSLQTSGYIAAGGAGANGCTIYTPTKGNQFITQFTADATKICQITFADGRIFDITASTFAWSNVNVVAPTGCICNEQMDIYILVDHSSSINDPKMLQFKTFVQTFLDNLNIAPNGINVGMGWFHFVTGINFPMTGDRNTVNLAMSQWWTNCTNPDAVSYCSANPTVPGCAGCQKGATATSTAIQGYNGPTTSPAFPSGTLTVTGAQEYFYNPANGGSSRKVPKMFLTLTDGAVNHFLNQNGGVDGCTFSGCSPDLKNAVSALRNRHNSLFPGYSLTTIAMGIGAPGTDPNLSLSPEHLAILAEGISTNWFTAPDFPSLSGQLRNLLLRSCPAANDLVQTTCQNMCCGLCVCGTCAPPRICRDNNLCTDQTLSVCCNEIATPITTSCPTPDLCTNAVCNKDVLTAAGGYGKCSFTPVDCSSFQNGCTKYNCTKSTGKCTTADTSACPPVPCTWGAWGAWQSCSVSCGTGTQIQKRTVNQTAANGGAACAGSDTNTQTCNMGCCPVPCDVSTWTAWVGCPNGQCDSGTKTRTRTINAQPTCGGTACPAAADLTQTLNCPACVNVNCSGQNNTITPCNCTTQVKTLQFQVVTPASGPRGVACQWADGTVFSNVPCTSTEIGKCPVNCVESWSQWGWCDCNYKTQNRTYTYISGPKNGGKACAYSKTFTEQQSCVPPAAQNCPLYGPSCTDNTSCTDSFQCTQDLCLRKPDGQLHCDWSYSTVCNPNLCYSNNTCDNSIGCLKKLKPISQACPVPNKCSIATCDPTGNNSNGACIVTQVNCSGFSSGCQLFTCDPSTGQCTVPDRSKCPPINCTWSDWSSWSSCTKSCGNGTTTITRIQNQTAKDGGIACTGASSQSKSCNEQCCVQDCTLNAWSSWSTCAACGTGNRTRTATISKQASCNGTDCLTVISPGANPNVTCVGSSCTWSEACAPCTPRNCTGYNNTHNGKCYCTSEGDGGYTLITFTVTQTQVGNGTNCSWPDGTVFNQTCNVTQVDTCPRPCHEQWTQWSECSCYSSTQTRSYSITQNATNGGTPCNYTHNFDQTQGCTPLTNCTDLGPLCTFDADCDDELACTIDKCTLITPPGEYHCNWVGTLVCDSNNICLQGACDNTVGCRNTTLPASQVCPPANACKIPACIVSGNGGAGACQFTDVNCSGFVGSGVDACEHYDCDGKTGKCTVPNRTLCPPIPCTWGEWGNWTQCPVTCGNSTVSRFRTINQTAKDGGADCVATDGNETQPCVMNGGCCPVDCVVGEWSTWDSSACQVCVPGNQIRTRNITSPATCGGQCVNLTDTALSCPPCVPVDCVEQNVTSDCRCTQNGTYGEWTVTYEVIVSPVGPGKPCNFTNGQNWTQPCNASAVALCPTPCEEMWTNWSVCDCFNNSQWQEYIITKNATNGGIACSLSQSQILNQTCTPSADQNCPNLGPACTVDLDCNDGLACTVDKCILFTPPGTYHCDWSSNLTCNDTSICTSDRCDQLLGCVFDQILFCDDSNNCTVDFCDPVDGCKHTNVTCPDLDVCNLAYCNPITGCGSVQRNCTGNLSAVLDNCTIAYCDVNYTLKGLTNPCQTQDICAHFNALGVGIAGGILALIIVLAILAALLFGGGVVAAATNIPVMNENAVQLNPLYMGSDTAANNPLFGSETV